MKKNLRKRKSALHLALYCTALYYKCIKNDNTFQSCDAMCLHAVFQLPFLFQTLYVFINAFVCARVCSLTMFFILSSSLLFSQHCLSSHIIMQICESSQLVQYFPL